MINSISKKNFLHIPKCIILISVVTGLVGIIIVTLGSLHYFGAKRSLGFVASIVGGSILIGRSIGGLWSATRMQALPPLTSKDSLNNLNSVILTTKNDPNDELLFFPLEEDIQKESQTANQSSFTQKIDQVLDLSRINLQRSESEEQFLDIEEEVIVISKERRLAFISTLSTYTKFDKALFDSIEDESLLKFAPIIEAIERGENKEDEIIRSECGEYIEFPKERFKGLSDTLSLFIDGISPVLQVIDHALTEDRTYKGAYKIGKKIGNYLFMTSHDLWLQLNLDGCKQWLNNEIMVESELNEIEKSRFRFAKKIIYHDSFGKIRICYISKFARYGSIHSAVENRQIPSSQVIPILIQIAEGLQILYNHNFAHLDFSWGNILIDQDQNGTFIAKIIDFDTIRRDQESCKMDISDFANIVELCNKELLDPLLPQSNALTALAFRMRQTIHVNPPVPMVPQDLLTELHRIQTL